MGGWGEEGGPHCTSLLSCLAGPQTGESAFFSLGLVSAVAPAITQPKQEAQDARPEAQSQI